MQDVSYFTAVCVYFQLIIVPKGGVFKSRQKEKGIIVAV